MWERKGQDSSDKIEDARWRCRLGRAPEKGREDTAVKARVRHNGEGSAGDRSRRRTSGEVLVSWDRVCALRNDSEMQWAHTSCKKGGEGSEGARGSLAAKSINP